MTAEIEIKALVNYRDFHCTTTAGNWQLKVTPVERGLRVDAPGSNGAGDEMAASAR